MKRYQFAFALILLLFALVSCDKDDAGPSEASAYTQKVTAYIHDVMSSCYLWNEQLPDLDLKYETDPKAYFYKLRVEEDVFSHITDDLEKMLKAQQGIEKTFGYSLAFMWADSDHTSIVGVVEYVYPRSPAFLAGLVRGDKIVLLDGRAIPEASLDKLINGPTVEIGVSKYKDGEYGEPEAVTMTVTELEQDPVHTSRILDVEGRKVGYLFYVSYIGNFNHSIDAVFDRFKEAGVSELILDLRYNLGGDENAIVNLCSHIAPAATCRSKDVIIRKEYNAIQEAYMKEEGVDNITHFTDSLLSSNLNLSRVFVLTSDNTYSASEVTIVGLQPYMDVVRIGERTGGKYTGMQLLPATVVVDGVEYLDPVIGNWAIYPIVLRYRNKNNEDPKGGLAPQYEVESFYLPMLPMGDEQDPLVARAIELMGGQSPAAAFRALKSGVQKPFRRVSSAFDEQKKNFFVE